MDIEQLKVGFMDVFCYLVSCSKTKEALVIDPAGSEEGIVERIKKTGLHLKYVVNTHGHGDHTCGNMKVKALTGASVVVHELDAAMLGTEEGREMALMWGFTPSPPADITVRDGDRIRAGEVALEVIHTPGHTPGGICLLGDGNLFTGDTLFVGSVGRTDLPGASASQLMRSLRERILSLPGETIVWPGHDYGEKPSSTIAHERSSNPWLI